jgi:hypothetical protein
MPFDHMALKENFGDIWPIHVDGFTELLITLRGQFRGDLDMMLVLAIIGSRTLPSRRTRGMSYQDFADGTRLDPRPSPINLQSIAECSGIPRETVRRKVRDLRALGWVDRRDDGVLVVNEKAAQDLAPATEATLRYLIAIGSACVGAAERAQKDERVS